MPRVCLSKLPNSDVGCSAAARTFACATCEFPKLQCRTSNSRRRGAAPACVPTAIPPSPTSAWIYPTARAARYASFLTYLSSSGHMQPPACCMRKHNSCCTCGSLSTALDHYVMEAMLRYYKLLMATQRYQNLEPGNPPARCGHRGMNEIRGAGPLPSQKVAHQPLP